MKEHWEKFAQMDISTWLNVIVISICATVVRLVVEGDGFSLRSFLIGSFMAAFLAYVTALYCLELNMSVKMMGVTVGIVTYQATNILTGIAKIGAAFAKDPFKFFEKTKRGGK